MIGSSQMSAASEPSFVWSGRNTISARQFEIRPRGLPPDAEPIYDEDLDCIIGYQQCRTQGVAHIYDLTGTFVSVSEAPLEPPPFEPLDAILIVGSLWRAGLRGIARGGIRGVGAAIGRSQLASLRTRFAAFMQRPLRFTATPLQHMKEAGRFVPVHILRLAILHGKRVTDPRGYSGFYM